MAADPIASRYAKALFDTAKAEGKIDETLEQLCLIGRLLDEHSDLETLFLDMDVKPEDKVEVLDRALRGEWSSLVRGAIYVVMSMGRAESLRAIIKAYEEIVDVDQGRLRVVVRAAYPIPDATLKSLCVRLERREGKKVMLSVQIAPELLGGLQLVMGNRLIDGSIRRQLTDLRQQLQSVRIN